MKNRIIAMLTILAVFGLAIAAYAYTRGTTVATTAASCCKKDGDSCPMKAKGHDDKGEHAGMSCDKMKSHGGEHAKAEGHECCGCCGESCPMKKEKAKSTSVSTTEDAKSCCDNCDCCKGKAKTSV